MQLHVIFWHWDSYRNIPGQVRNVLDPIYSHILKQLQFIFLINRISIVNERRFRTNTELRVENCTEKIHKLTAKIYLSSKLPFSRLKVHNPKPSILNFWFTNYAQFVLNFDLFGQFLSEWRNPLWKWNGWVEKMYT